MVDFSNLELVQQEILSYIEKVNFDHEIVDAEEGGFEFRYQVDIPNIDLNIHIGLTGNTPFRIDFVIAVNFSQEHLSVLKANPDNVIAKLKDEIFLWMTPRDPQYILDLQEENNFERSYYLVITPIYDGELSFGNFMRAIDQTINGTLLIRKLIQNKLNQYVILLKEEA